MTPQALSRCDSLFLAVLTMAFVIVPPVASSEEINSFDQFVGMQTTISAVARLLQPSLPSGGSANIDTTIRDLGTHLEAIRNAQGKETAGSSAAKGIEEHYEQCRKAVKRFSDTTQRLPGLVKVATQEELTHTFAFTQGRNLAVLWCKGDGKSLPSLERILVDAEATGPLTSTQTGEGHHFCFLEFTDLALGEHRYRIEFKSPHPCFENLIVRVAESSKLTVHVVEEPGGAPVPCMIALSSLTDYTYRTPQEAVDFDGHFDDGPRIRTLISLGAPYWKELTASCIEGVATFEVFAGKWKLSVAKGIEYTPYFEEFPTGKRRGGREDRGLETLGGFHLAGVVLRRWPCAHLPTKRRSAEAHRHMGQSD